MHVHTMYLCVWLCTYMQGLKGEILICTYITMYVIMLVTEARLQMIGKDSKLARVVGFPTHVTLNVEHVCGHLSRPYCFPISDQSGQVSLQLGSSYNMTLGRNIKISLNFMISNMFIM